MLLVSRTVWLLPGRRLRGQCGDCVCVGLDDDVLDDLLFFGVEDFGQGFVKLGLVLLEFFRKNWWSAIDR